MPCNVDASLFESVQEAIDFVEERGGGVVRTDLVNPLWAKSWKVPATVKLEFLQPEPHTIASNPPYRPFP